MTISLKHAFTSGKSDGGDATLVQPSNWNAEHTITLATDTVLGRSTAGTGAAEEITCTATGRSIIDDASVAAVRATLMLLHMADVHASGRTACNLYVRYTSATQVTVSADSVWLIDSSGDAKLFSSVSEVAAITSSGASGLDTGSEGSSTWYYVWLIGKTDGTIDALLSASATAPTLPSGYTYKGRVGVVRNNSSSDFEGFQQRGGTVNSVLSANALTAGSQTSFTSVSLASFIPPEAQTVFVRGSLLSTSGTNSCTLGISGGSASTEPRFTEQTNAATTTAVIANFPPIVIITAQTIYYRVQGTNASCDLGIMGFTLW